MLYTECEHIIRYYNCFIYENWDDDIREQLTLLIGRDRIGINFDIDSMTNSIIPLLDGPFTTDSELNNSSAGKIMTIRGPLGWTADQYIQTKRKIQK